MRLVPPATTLLLLLFTTLACGQEADTGDTGSDTTETVSNTVPIAADGSVTIDNHEGSISVTTWDRAEVQYEARIEAESGADHPERTTVSVSSSARHLELRTEYDESDDGGFLDWDNQNVMPVHYTINMPNAARLTINDHESNIEVTGLQAELRIDTHEGPITIAHQQGNLVIDSHESRMQLRDVAGRVELDTHEGAVTVENLRGGFEMDTHEGRIDVSFATLDNDVEIDSYGGTFTLTLPTNAGFGLDTDFSDDAGIDSNLDLGALRIAETNDEEVVNYRGSVNGGGPQIRLSSHEGRFSLRAR